MLLREDDDPLEELDSTTIGEAVVSTSQMRVAGLRSSLPAPSFAFTSKLLGPLIRPAYSAGEVQAENPAPSSWH